MGMAANGGMNGIGTGFSAATSRTGSSASSQLAMMEKIRRKNQRPKKKLNYNPREIANQLQRATKSRNASVVLTRAKSKVASLQSAKASGQYKDSDVRIALAHARRMVECTRMKVRNLKEEELLTKRNDRDHSTKEQQKKGEIKRRVRQKEKDIKLKMEIEENQKILKEKMRRQELTQKRRRHRTEEQGKITEADMKYLQGLGENDRPVHSVDMGSAALELSLAAERLAELQRMEQQVEQQVEMEVEMEMSGLEAGNLDMAAIGDARATEASAEETASAPGATVDVMV